MTKNTHDSDVAFIRALAELLNENDLTELQVKRDYAEDDSLNVRVSRKPPQQIMAPQSVQAAPPMMSSPSSDSARIMVIACELIVTTSPPSVPI